MKLLTLVGLALALGASASWADGDATQGEQIFKKCEACHTVADKANKVGPSLLGVVGRKVASVADFNRISKKKKSEFFGRSSQNKVVVFSNKDLAIGDLVRVKILDCTQTTLIGEVECKIDAPTQ